MFGLIVLAFQNLGPLIILRSIYHFASKQLRSWPEAALAFLHDRCLPCPLLQSCLTIRSKYITTSRIATKCVWYKVIKSGPSGIFDIVLCPDNSYHLLSYIFGVFLCSESISMSNVSNLFQNGHFTILKVRRKAKIVKYHTLPRTP